MVEKRNQKRRPSNECEIEPAAEKKRAKVAHDITINTVDDFTTVGRLPGGREKILDSLSTQYKNFLKFSEARLGQEHRKTEGELEETKKDVQQARTEIDNLKAKVASLERKLARERRTCQMAIDALVEIEELASPLENVFHGIHDQVWRLDCTIDEERDEETGDE